MTCWSRLRERGRVCLQSLMNEWKENVWSDLKAFKVCSELLTGSGSILSVRIHLCGYILIWPLLELILYIACKTFSEYWSDATSWLSCIIDKDVDFPRVNSIQVLKLGLEIESRSLNFRFSHCNLSNCDKFLLCSDVLHGQCVLWEFVQQRVSLFGDVALWNCYYILCWVNDAISFHCFANNGDTTKNYEMILA